MHNIGYLHRDVKPGNFCMGRAELNELRKVYVLDFGMARKFVHDDGTIKNPRAVAGFRGTVKYAPVRARKVVAGIYPLLFRFRATCNVNCMYRVSQNEVDIAI